MVPADVQLMSGDYLSIDQSSLTGESLPVTKRSGEAAYANSIIKQGEMLGLVVNTATNTRFHSVVALPAVLSVTMAVGALNLARKQAIAP